MSEEQLGIWIMTFVLAAIWLFVLWELFEIVRLIWAKRSSRWWLRPSVWATGIGLVLAAVLATWAANSHHQTEPEQTPAQTPNTRSPGWVQD